MFEMLRYFVIGMFVGIANVIPGVSGGTLIVVFNIYDKLVNSITINLKKLFQNWKFFVPFFIGMAAGIVIFSKGITILFDRFPIPTFIFFIGLIIGSIPLLAGCTFKSNEQHRFSAMKIFTLVISIIAGIAVIISFAFLETQFSDAKAFNSIKAALPELDFLLWIKLFIGGMLGAIAMIIPGISGSLLMLIIGVYTVILSAVSGLLSGSTFFSSASILIPAGLGVLAGLFAGAKLISILIAKVPNYTYGVILGLIIGSAVILFPDLRGISTTSIIISILCLCAGFCLAFFSSRISDATKDK